MSNFIKDVLPNRQQSSVQYFNYLCTPEPTVPIRLQSAILYNYQLLFRHGLKLGTRPYSDSASPVEGGRR